jgi:hypothetical protein
VNVIRFYSLNINNESIVEIFYGFEGCQNFRPFFRVFPDVSGMESGKNMPVLGKTTF